MGRKQERKHWPLRKRFAAIGMTAFVLSAMTGSELLAEEAGLEVQVSETVSQEAGEEAAEKKVAEEKEAAEKKVAGESEAAAEKAAEEKEAAEKSDGEGEAAETQTEEPEAGEISSGAQTEAAAQEQAGPQAEASDETEASDKTETSDETKMPKETEISDEAETQTEEETGEKTEAFHETKVSDETEAETPEETASEQMEETEAVFASGYAYVKKGSIVYRGREETAGTELGCFTEKTVVYAAERFTDEDSGNDWLRIVFVLKEETVSVSEGYIRAAQLLPADEEELNVLTAQMGRNPEHVCPPNLPEFPLIPADFERKDEKSTALDGVAEEETTAAETDTESEAGTEAAAALVQYMMTADWEKETLEMGDEITLTAVCETAQDVLWQSSEDGTEWTTIAESSHYTYVLTEENCHQLIRAISSDEMQDGGEEKA